MYNYLIPILSFLSLSLCAQQINARFPAEAGQVVALYGYDYYAQPKLDSATVDAQGNFRLRYPKNYTGAAVINNGQSGLTIFLNGKDLTIRGQRLSDYTNLDFDSNEENAQFYSYAKLLNFRNSVEPALVYVQEKYVAANANPIMQSEQDAIQSTLQGVIARESQYVNKIPSSTYLAKYLPYFRLLQDMYRSLNLYRAKLLPTQNRFRAMDFQNPALRSSGLFKDLVQNHFALFEGVENVTEEMHKSLDVILPKIHADGNLGRQFVENMFAWFEGRSHFGSAAYLSEKVLDAYPTLANAELTQRMRVYTELKLGDKAPDIDFGNKTLYDYKQPILLVFSSSTCATCKKEARELLKYYAKWKKTSNVETIYISLDTDKAAYTKAYANAPWLMHSDFLGMDSPIAQDYALYKDTTYMLLDEEKKIIVHGKSPEHVDVWVRQKFEKK